MRQKVLDEKLWYAHSLSFSIPETFKNTEGLPYEFFQYCQTKHFQLKIVILPFGIVFWYQKFSETPKGHFSSFLWQIKRIRHLFVLWFTKNLHRTSRQHQKVSVTLEKGLIYSDTVRKKFSTVFGDTLLWFTKTFALDRWETSTLMCSQLVLVSVQICSITFVHFRFRFSNYFFFNIVWGFSVLRKDYRFPQTKRINWTSCRFFEKRNDWTRKIYSTIRDLYLQFVKWIPF